MPRMDVRCGNRNDHVISHRWNTLPCFECPICRPFLKRFQCLNVLDIASIATANLHITNCFPISLQPFGEAINPILWTTVHQIHNNVALMSPFISLFMLVLGTKNAKTLCACFICCAIQVALFSLLQCSGRLHLFSGATLSGVSLISCPENHNWYEKQVLSDINW